LILAYCEEPLTQARDKMRLVWPEADIGLVAGKLGLEQWGHRVIVGGVRTFARRIAWLFSRGVLRCGIVIVVEVHHTIASTSTSLWEALPDTCLLEVTATNNRCAGSDIQQLFGEPVFQQGPRGALPRGQKRLRSASASWQAMIWCTDSSLADTGNHHRSRHQDGLRSCT
jgi:superfamily II DNA or RNA helicase